MLEDKDRGHKWFEQQPPRDILADAPEGEKNPLCKCGCGYEVVKPWHTYVLGHSALMRYSDEVIREVQRLLAAGNSHRSIAKATGVSSATVSKVATGDRTTGRKPPPAVLRATDISDYVIYQLMKKTLAQARKRLPGSVK